MPKLFRAINKHNNSRFHTAFAKSVLGKDNILVLTDKATRPYFTGGPEKLPADVFLDANLEDIWIRDFGTVLQSKPIKFSYKPGYLKHTDAQYIEKSFIDFLQQNGITLTGHTENSNHKEGLNIPFYQNLVIDGGNVVFNMVDKAILTSRIYEENKNIKNIQKELRDALGYSQVAIVTQFGDMSGKHIFFISSTEATPNKQ